MWTRLKDPVSGLTHLAGAILGAGGLALLLLQCSARGASTSHYLSFSIFGVSVVLLYLSSAAYHLLDVSDRARYVLRQLDHSMIFVLIAGSYTPFCAVALGGSMGWTLLAVVWGLALAGLTMKVFRIEPPRWISTGLYLLMGWLVMVVIVPLSRVLSVESMAWLVFGGMAYTVGAVIYAMKRPDPFPPYFGFHEIWHLLVLTGSFCHFLSVAYLLT